MDKLKMHSPNLTQDNIARLRELFPGCVTEAMDHDGLLKLAVDFDQLQQELSDSIVEGPQERYHLNWPGKREALLTANAPIAKTLHPSREESVNFNTTKNIFIEGDNLDALKLLQETYLGKVKMIYIDPPYNTGNDFLYLDDFCEDSNSYLIRTNQVSSGNEHLMTNTESNGRFHSDWLSMIYSRLKLSRNLLKEDGVIYVSIGEEELSNLEKVCNEIFGEFNKVSIVARIAKTASNKGTHFAPSIDFVLCYAKNISCLPGFKDKVDINLYKKIESHGSRKGQRYRDDVALYQSSLDPMRGCTNQRYYIEAPDGSLLLPPGSNFPRNKVDGAFVTPETKEDKVWRWSYSTYFLKKDLLVFKPSARSPLLDSDGQPAKWNIYTKSFFSDREADGTLPRNILTDFINRKGADLLKKYGINFDYSKPVELIEYLLEITGVREEDIVMDFFAGSCTTAHAVINRNLLHQSNIRFICIQLREDLASSEFDSVSDIGMERIRRVIKKIKLDYPQESDNLDLGFRVFIVDSSNMEDVYYLPNALDKGQIPMLIENIKSDSTPEDLLFQIMLDWGVDLALPINRKIIQGKEVFLVDGNALAACFDARGGVDEDLVKELARQKPLRVVFRDSGYKDNAIKINVEQIFKLLSPATEVKTI